MWWEMPTGLAGLGLVVTYVSRLIPEMPAVVMELSRCLSRSWCHDWFVTARGEEQGQTKSDAFHRELSARVLLKFSTAVMAHRRMVFAKVQSFA